MNRIRIDRIVAFSYGFGNNGDASAQWRDGTATTPYDDRYGNGGYNNGRYAITATALGSSRLKNRTKELQRHMDRDRDDSRKRNRREDQLNDPVRQFRLQYSLSESNRGRNKDNKRFKSA